MSGEIQDFRENCVKNIAKLRCRPAYTRDWVRLYFETVAMKLIKLFLASLVMFSAQSTTRADLSTLPEGTFVSFVSADSVGGVTKDDGPSSNPVASIEGGSFAMEDGPVGFNIDATYSVADATTLRTDASIEISASNDEAFWNSVEATAAAKSSIISFGFVDDPNAPLDGRTGRVQFHWELDPMSFTLLGLSDVEDISINELSAVTTLTTTTVDLCAGCPELFEFHEITVAADTLINELVAPSPENGGLYVFETAWAGSGPVPVEFTLETSIDLDIAANSPSISEFSVDLQTSFGNSAYLREMVILEDIGGDLVELPDAHFNIASVPEPSSIFAMGLFAALVWTSAHGKRLRLQYKSRLCGR